MKRLASWRAWLSTLLLSGAGIAHAGPCDLGGCSATRIDPALLRQAAREADRGAPAVPPARRELLPPDREASAPARAWNRQLGNPVQRETYDCALSFGIGGVTGGGGFLGTRLLGHTQVWHDGDAR